uniref:Imidazolonepropionase n=1 Tax=Panagrolaimus sp. ES5 TaxID=591445 RepID=A0AC34GBE2_9BILA
MVFFPSAINQYFSEAEGTIVLENLRQIVQIVDDNVTQYLTGKDMNGIKIIGSESRDLAVVVVDGVIKDIGRLADLEAKLDLSTSPRYDCGGGCLLPGLVDGHSHPVFAGDRVHEFAMKLAGATYMEVCLILFVYRNPVL